MTSTNNVFPLKTQESAKTGHFLRLLCPTPVPCARHECIAPYVFSVTKRFFSVLEKITIPLFDHQDV